MAWLCIICQIGKVYSTILNFKFNSFKFNVPYIEIFIIQFKPQSTAHSFLYCRWIIEIMQLFIRLLKQIIWQDKLIKRHRIQKPERIECEKGSDLLRFTWKIYMKYREKINSIYIDCILIFSSFISISWKKTFSCSIYIYMFYSYIFNNAKYDFVFTYIGLYFLFLLVTPYY